MSTRIMALCWPLRMPPTAKSVLVSLADNANDNGNCWPSIPTICERTCFSRRAVIDAIAWLEVAGAMTADRSNGRHTTYIITPEKYVEPVQQAHPCSSRTGASGAQTSASPALDPCISRTGPVQQAHPNRKEPSRTIEATVKKRAVAPTRGIQKPADVTEQTWNDWLTLRRAKKAPVTETVLANANTEAAKAAMPLEKFLAIWCARGSQGLQAEWLKPNERGPPGNGSKPSAAADFRGKTYDATPDDQLPPGLR